MVLSDERARHTVSCNSHTICSLRLPNNPQAPLGNFTMFVNSMVSRNSATSANVVVYEHDTRRRITNGTASNSEGIEVNLQHGSVAYEAVVEDEAFYTLEPVIFFRPSIEVDLVVPALPVVNDSSITYVALQSNQHPVARLKAVTGPGESTLAASIVNSVNFT